MTDLPVGLGGQDLENARRTALEYIYSLYQDPRLPGNKVEAKRGTIALQTSGGPAQLFQKLDDGLTNNWQLVTGIPGPAGPAGPAGPMGPAGTATPTRWFDIQPQDGHVLPISAPRAYYPAVLFESVPTFFDGATLRKYLAYFGGGASGQAYAAFSDDGVTFDHETLVSGLAGIGYHAASLDFGGLLHYFYWDTTVTIYSAAAVRHAVFNPAVSCTAPISDAPCTGGYIYGVSGGGNLRAGTYGFDQVFHNATPTNNPANPYSYEWCAIVGGTDGSQEGILFATSPDGYNFSPWNALQEVIPRGAPPTWDQWIGRSSLFIDSAGLWHGFYSGGLGTSAGEDTNFGGGIGYATSLDGITWVKWDKNPVIRKTESLKSWKRLYTPWVLLDASPYKLYFSCKSQSGVYTVALASFDGFI